MGLGASRIATMRVEPPAISGRRWASALPGRFRGDANTVVVSGLMPAHRAMGSEDLDDDEGPQMRLAMAGLLAIAGKNGREAEEK